MDSESKNRRYYVEYCQDCGFGAGNVACVVIKAKDLEDLHRRLKDRDFGKDDPDHNYCISYYTEIEDGIDDFIKNIIKGTSNVDCIIEIVNDDISKTNKEIINSFKDEDYSKTIICTEYEIKNKLLLSDVHDIMMSKGIEMKYSNNVLSKVKNFIKVSINRLCSGISGLWL